MRRAASIELRVLWRPTSTFAELSRDPAEGWARLLGRTGLLLLVLASAVSLTTAGRLVPIHLASGFLAWAFVPVIQLLAAAAVLWGMGRRGELARWLSVYAAGNGPWLLAFVVLPALLLLSPEAALSFWIGRGALPAALGLTLSWGVVLTFVFHRAALGAPRGSAAVATACDLVAKVSLTLAWFHGMDNLVPELFGASAP